MKLWTRLALLPLIVFVECYWAQEIYVKDDVQAVEGDDVILPCFFLIGKVNNFKWSQLIENNSFLIYDSTARNSSTLGDMEKGNCSHTIFNASRSHGPMTFQVEITIDWEKKTKNVTLHVAAAPRSHTGAGGGKDTAGGENSPTPGTSWPTLTVVVVAGVVILLLICFAAVVFCVKKRRSSGTSLHSPRADGGEAALEDAENIEILPVTNGVANAHLAVEASPLERVGFLAKLSSLVKRPIQHRPVRSEDRLQWRCCGKM